MHTVLRCAPSVVATRSTSYCICTAASLTLNKRSHAIGTAGTRAFPGAQHTPAAVFSPAALGAFSSRPQPPARAVRAMATSPIGIDVPAGQELAVLGGGCFWCLEACYQQLKGVKGVVSGYAGGDEPNPTYQQVCGKQTGHAEVVAVTYDPSIITFKDLLDVFFTIHDPTTPNRQGADVGPQYRSIILYVDEQQKKTAEQVMAEVTKEQLYPGPLVTQLVPLERFWPGEDYHQNYYNDNPSQGYCRAVVAPKVAKFRSKYMSKLMA